MLNRSAPARSDRHGRPSPRAPRPGYRCESLSVFTDSRLLLRRLRGEPLPFSDQVLYILDRQLDEAGVLILNKADLLDAKARAELEELARARLPGTPMISQNSLHATEVSRWRDLVESGGAPAPAFAIPIDYDRYGAGRPSCLGGSLTADGAAAARDHSCDRCGRETARHGAPRGSPEGHVSSANASPKSASRRWDKQTGRISPMGTVDLLLNARIRRQPDGRRVVGRRPGPRDRRIRLSGGSRVPTHDATCRSRTRPKALVPPVTCFAPRLHHWYNHVSVSYTWEILTRCLRRSARL